MELWEYILLFMSVIFGGGLAFYLKSSNRSLLQLTLSFSGAYILGITVLHIAPVVFGNPARAMGVWVIAGFFVQVLLEQLSQGVEHGHIHAAHHPNNYFAAQIMFGLCVHAFMEGMPLSTYDELHQSIHNHDHHNHLLFGIVLHKAPAAFALCLLLLLSKFSKGLTFLFLIIFASMSPLGAAVSEYLFSSGILNPDRNLILLAIVLGSFLHIATTILFEVDNSAHHRIPLKKLLSIAAGLGIALLTMH